MKCFNRRRSSFQQAKRRGSYRVGLQAQANFSAPTFEPAHEARAGKRAALSVYLSQLQLRCSNSITGLQASSSRSELSAKWAAKNVIAFCRADRNLSSKTLARYIQSKKRTSKVIRRSYKKKQPDRPSEGVHVRFRRSFVDVLSCVRCRSLSKSVVFAFFKIVVF